MTVDVDGLWNICTLYSTLFMGETPKMSGSIIPVTLPKYILGNRTSTLAGQSFYCARFHSWGETPGMPGSMPTVELPGMADSIVRVDLYQDSKGKNFGH